MSDKNVTNLVFRGRLQYARVLGDPVLNYNKDGHEWKFDFIPNDQNGAKKELEALGVGERLRSLEDSEGNPRYDGEMFLSFRQNAHRKDGSENYPIKVEDVKGTKWPEDLLLGNDTVADVRFVVIDNGKGRFHGVYPRSIRVLQLVKYESKEFDPISEDDEFYQQAQETANEIALLAGTNPAESSGDEIDVERDLTDELPV